MFKTMFECELNEASFKDTLDGDEKFIKDSMKEIGVTVKKGKVVKKGKFIPLINTTTKDTVEYTFSGSDEAIKKAKKLIGYE